MKTTNGPETRTPAAEITSTLGLKSPPPTHPHPSPGSRDRGTARLLGALADLRAPSEGGGPPRRPGEAPQGHPSVDRQASPGPSREGARRAIRGVPHRGTAEGDVRRRFRRRRAPRSPPGDPGPVLPHEDDRVSHLAHGPRRQPRRGAPG